MQTYDIGPSAILADKYLMDKVYLSEMSLDEMRSVRSCIRERIKAIDKLSEDDSVGYKELEKLSDERYSLSRALCTLEDSLIRRQRNSMNLSSTAFNGGGIYTDISDKSFNRSTGRSAKFALHGISI